MSDHLNGKILIGLPKDDKFPLIFICGQDHEGSIGFMINQPMIGLDSIKLLKEFNIIPPKKEIPLYYGGPFETSRGFVLHTLDHCLSSTITLDCELGITATLDMLKLISKDKGPLQYLLAMGYISWKAGELEEEIKNNEWIVCNLNYSILFELPIRDRWRSSLLSIGITDPFSLLSYGGQA